MFAFVCVCAFCIVANSRHMLHNMKKLLYGTRKKTKKFVYHMCIDIESRLVSQNREYYTHAVQVLQATTMQSEQISRVFRCQVAFI